MNNKEHNFFDTKKREEEDAKAIKKYEERELLHDDDYVQDMLRDELLNERKDKGASNDSPSKSR